MQEACTEWEDSLPHHKLALATALGTGRACVLYPVEPKPASLLNAPGSTQSSASSSGKLFGMSSCGTICSHRATVRVAARVADQADRCCAHGGVAPEVGDGEPEPVLLPREGTVPRLAVAVRSNGRPSESQQPAQAYRCCTHKTIMLPFGQITGTAFSTPFSSSPSLPMAL